MLDFGSYGLVYEDEVDNGASLETPNTTILSSNRFLRVEHPLLDTDEKEILMGVMLRKFIRYDSDFVIESPLYAENIAGLFEVALLYRADHLDSPTIDSINELETEYSHDENSVSSVIELLTELLLLGFICAGEVEESILCYNEATQTVYSRNISTVQYIPTELFLSVLKGMEITEF